MTAVREGGKMAKQGSDGGFFDRMFRPLKKQRVTLTKAGKGQAPLRKGKAARKAGRKAQAAEKARPMTAREKQVRELKMLANIGKQDPERLAGIISRMLLEGQRKDEADRQMFERLIWEKIEKRQPDRGAQEAEGGTDDGAD
jgi:hypothetical protein